MDEILFRKRRSPDLDIKLIPLINVIFLLLIFFLVAGTYSPVDETEINMPYAETSSRIVDDSFKHISITLMPGGDIMFNDKKNMTLKMLEKDLEYYMEQYPGQEIVIKADQSLKAEYLIDVIRMISVLGGSDISIATENLNL